MKDDNSSEILQSTVRTYQSNRTSHSKEIYTQEIVRSLRMIPSELRHQPPTVRSTTADGFMLAIFYEAAAGKHDRAIQLVGQAAVASTNHHGTDDDLAERAELSAKRC
jgi:hypothetical protein